MLNGKPPTFDDFSYAYKVKGYVEAIFVEVDKQINEFVKRKGIFPSQEMEIKIHTEAAKHVTTNWTRGIKDGYRLTQHEISENVRRERDQRLRAGIVQIRKTHEQNVEQVKKLYGSYPTEDEEYIMHSKTFAESKLQNSEIKKYTISKDEQEGLNGYVRLYRTERKKLWGGKFGCLSCFY
jgi:post-segregation antitoxin (ccd killing protein)